MSASSRDATLFRFHNCRILRDHEIVRDDLWVRDARIVNPERVFFDERRSADVQIDCRDAIIAPGFIDVQINGKLDSNSAAQTVMYGADKRRRKYTLLLHFQIVIYITD